MTQPHHCDPARGCDAHPGRSPQGPLLRADPDDLTADARAHTVAAAEIDAAQPSAACSTADLAVTFGVIGADFLAALLHTLEVYRHNVDSIAARERSLAGKTVAASAAYQQGDVGNVGRFGPVTGEMGV